MIFTKETLKDVKTASDIKHALPSDNYFFERGTMRFFGDKMSSFGVRTIDGIRVMYRKPSARVNVFGTWKQTGRDFFNAWEIVPKQDHLDLNLLNEDQTEKIYNSL